MATRTRVEEDLGEGSRGHLVRHSRGDTGLGPVVRLGRASAPRSPRKQGSTSDESGVIKQRVG
jgi:hypothetical protein